MTQLRIVTTVCTGNLCRSPLAEALLRKHLDRLGVVDVMVQSAGLGATDGQRAIEASRRAGAALGAELNAHRAQVLERRIIDESELVLCASSEHIEQIRRRWPDISTEKLKLFAQMLEGEAPVDIEDPIGFDEAMFHLIARVIDGAMEGWARSLVRNPWLDS